MPNRRQRRKSDINVKVKEVPEIQVKKLPNIIIRNKEDKWEKRANISLVFVNILLIAGILYTSAFTFPQALNNITKILNNISNNVGQTQISINITNRSISDNIIIKDCIAVCVTRHATNITTCQSNC